MARDEAREWLYYGLAYRYPVDEQFTNPPMPAEADVRQWIARIEHLLGALQQDLTC